MAMMQCLLCDDHVIYHWLGSAPPIVVCDKCRAAVASVRLRMASPLPSQDNVKQCVIEHIDCLVPDSEVAKSMFKGFRISELPIRSVEKLYVYYAQLAERSGRISSDIRRSLQG